MSVCKAMVTGAKGELSRAVCDYLNNKNIFATCISVRGQEWQTRDLSEFDSIVHIAGVVPKEGITADDFYRVNRDLTIELAQKAKADGTKHFIYISSMAVYGIKPSLDAVKGTVTENTPCNPESDYGKSKLEAENGLHELESDDFIVSIIRVPSIYSATKLDYFEQYRFIMRKFRSIPLAYQDRHRSAICVDNLCEIIRLIICYPENRIYCPDDGKLTAKDYCLMIDQQKHCSVLTGLVAKVLRWHPAVVDCFGAVAYDDKLTSVFDGKYRIVSAEKMAERIKNENR